MLFEIGVRHLHRPGDRCRNPVGKPATKRIIDYKQGKGGGDHSRQRGHAAEQQRKAPVKLVARHLLPTLCPQPQDLTDHKAADNDHRQHIDGDQGRQQIAVRLRRIELRQCENGIDPDGKRRQDREITDPVFGEAQQQPAPCRCLCCHRPDHMPSSRMRLRSVLRFMPRISAALTWLPRVISSVATISGCSTSRRMRA